MDERLEMASVEVQASAADAGAAAGAGAVPGAGGGAAGHAPGRRVGGLVAVAAHPVRDGAGRAEPPGGSTGPTPPRRAHQVGLAGAGGGDAAERARDLQAGSQGAADAADHPLGGARRDRARHARALYAAHSRRRVGARRAGRRRRWRRGHRPAQAARRRLGGRVHPAGVRHVAGSGGGVPPRSGQGQRRRASADAGRAALLPGRRRHGACLVCQVHDALPGGHRRLPRADGVPGRCRRRGGGLRAGRVEGPRRAGRADPQRPARGRGREGGAIVRRASAAASAAAVLVTAVATVATAAPARTERLPSWLTIADTRRAPVQVIPPVAAARLAALQAAKHPAIDRYRHTSYDLRADGVVEERLVVARQFLSNEGVREEGTLALSASASTDRVTIDEAYVMLPDGRRRPFDARTVQVVAPSGDELFHDFHTVALPFAELAPGATAVVVARIVSDS